jgi:hypothetical protein
MRLGKLTLDWPQRFGQGLVLTNPPGTDDLKLAATDLILMRSLGRSTTPCLPKSRQGFANCLAGLPRFTTPDREVSASMKA